MSGYGIGRTALAVTGTKLAAAGIGDTAMRHSGGLLLQVCASSGDDTEYLMDLARLLRGELLELDVAAVDEVPDSGAPAGAKGTAAIAGWLAVQLGPEALKAVVAKVAGWATRNNRKVKVTLNGDTLEVEGISRDEQARIIDNWLSRHPAVS